MTLTAEQVREVVRVLANRLLIKPGFNLDSLVESALDPRFDSWASPDGSTHAVIIGTAGRVKHPDGSITTQHFDSIAEACQWLAQLSGVVEQPLLRKDGKPRRRPLRAEPSPAVRPALAKLQRRVSTARQA